MTLNTRHFGEIDLDDSKLINFKDGVPGFSNLHTFALLADNDTSEMAGLFYWLQSVEDPSIAFVMINMLKIMPDYDPKVEQSEVAGLGEYNPDTFVFYNIAVLPENIRDMTVNLKAPIVINEATKEAKQAVCTNDEYSIRHYIFH